MRLPEVPPKSREKASGACVTDQQPACERQKIDGGYECHRCKSLWSDMLAKIEYRPRDCVGREHHHHIKRGNTA